MFDLNKERAERKTRSASLCQAFKLLCGVNCSRRAYVLASAAIDANVGVYDVFVSAFCDCLNGAGTCARSTAYTFIRNKMCHNFLHFYTF